MHSNRTEANMTRVVAVSAIIRQTYETFQKRSIKEPTQIQDQVKQTFATYIENIIQATPKNFTIDLLAPIVDIKNISQSKHYNFRTIF